MSAFPERPEFPALIENAGKSDHSSQAGLGSYRTRDFDGPDLMDTISSIVGLPAHLQPNPAPHDQSGIFPDYSFTEMKRQFGGDPEPVEVERIDHAAEARRIMSAELNGYNEGNDPHGAALAHATLALVEVQHTANLIAYGQGLLAGLRHGPIDLGGIPVSAYQGTLADVGNLDVAIRERLGLS